MNELDILDNPIIFFQEMRQVLNNIDNEVMYGNTGDVKDGKVKSNEVEFVKYLQSKWKELKDCLRDVQSTKTKQLYFYLPLLDFKQFLHSLPMNNSNNQEQK
mmetsp:Transcript_27668/g.43815  ORF Transcript_27668/g.43815 Transcript_27668/m.43815 type:complete len:102 (-) Transcript_27668:126-431(-)